MDSTFWLVFDHKGIVKHTKSPPWTGAGQRAVRIKASIPDEAFEPAGYPTATLDVPASALIQQPPEVIVAAVEPEMPQCPKCERTEHVRCLDEGDGEVNGFGCDYCLITFGAPEAD